jgi:CRISPR-associated protein Csx10
MGYALRPGVAISRRRKVAEEELLFFSETVAPMPLTFTSVIEVLGPLPNPPGQEETIRLLRAASRSLNALGADKSRGLGHLEADLEVEEFPGLGAARSQVSPSMPQGADMILTLMPEEYVRISGVKVANNFMESLDFLPGGTVRGAIAHSFVNKRKRGDWQDPEVRRAFLQEPIIVSNFYPSAGGLAQPIPLSARTCKRYPGLAYKRKRRRESHGARDILIAATLVKLLREKGIPIVLQDRCQVEGCGSPLKLLEGFIISPFLTALAEDEGRPSRRTMTKTAIDRARFTSAEGQLYTYETLDTKLEEPLKGKRLRFVGLIRNLPHELKAHLLGQILLVGGARGRGFGKVRIERIEPLGEEKPDQLRDRLDRFTNTFQEVLGAWDHPKKDSLFFAFTLLSDLIPPLGRDWKGWLVQEIAQRLSLEKDKLALEKAFTRVVYRGGFNMAVGLRKDLLPALAMGSAFVFSYPEAGEGIRKALIQGVQGLLRTGLGLRREEGYGEVSFCDEFHLERQQQS